MEFPSLTPDLCGTLAREVFGLPKYNSNKTNEALDKEICESFIGTSYNVCSELWNLINPSMKTELQGAHPKHLFWTLLFLKCYCIEPVLIRVVGGVDPKTYRKWVRLFIPAISGLKADVVGTILVSGNFPHLAS
jgi:hypothetical protein